MRVQPGSEQGCTCKVHKRHCVFDCVCSKLAGVALFLFSLEAVPESLQDAVRSRKIPHSACEFCLAMNYSQTTMQPIRHSQFKTKLNVSDTSKTLNE